MPDTRYATPAGSPALDEGLRAYMVRVYGYLTLGLALSAATAFAVRHASVTEAHVDGATRLARGLWLTPLGETLLGWKVLLGAFVASIVIIFAMARAVGKASYTTSAALYLAFTVLFGPLLVVATARFSAASVVQVLCVTTATFGAVSLYGYTTRRDLTGLGGFLFMGLVGLVGVGLVNVAFLHSSALQTLTSAVGVLVFVGYTAYDTQKIKEAYSSRMSAGEEGAVAVWGAMDLYLDFVNLFLDLLNLMGDAGGAIASGIGDVAGSIGDSIDLD